jgi:hypothetical protein
MVCFPVAFSSDTESLHATKPSEKAPKSVKERIEVILFNGLKIHLNYLIFAPLIRDVAQSGSVHAWGACGRWFESSHPDNKHKQLLKSKILANKFENR